jgi:hypothetical protein
MSPTLETGVASIYDPPNAAAKKAEKTTFGPNAYCAPRVTYDLPPATAWMIPPRGMYIVASVVI